MVAMVAVSITFAAGETTRLSYIGKCPEASHQPREYSLSKLDKFVIVAFSARSGREGVSSTPQGT